MKQTIQQALEILATDNEKRVAFGLPKAIKVGKHDTMAARLLLWLYENGEENQTVGDVVDILNAAQWWQTLFSSIYKEENDDDN